MPAGDIYELNVDQQIAGQDITNVYHFKQIGADGTGDAREAVDAMWDTVFKGAYLACVTDQTTLDQYRVRRISPTTTQSQITTAVGTGVETGEGLPTQSCAILRCAALPSGRKGTGHVKISGVLMDFISQGRIDTALEALMVTFGALMESNQTDAGSGYVFRQVVWSIIDSVARDILSARPTARIKTVHSRQIGVGD